jgi:hypothetical protein
MCEKANKFIKPKIVFGDLLAMRRSVLNPDALYEREENLPEGKELTEIQYEEYTSPVIVIMLEIFNYGLNYEVMCNGGRFIVNRSDVSKIYRQDQLQRMVKQTGLLHRFYDYCINIETKLYSSFERYWLSFVMKELHNKKWDGEDWV